MFLGGFRPSTMCCTSEYHFQVTRILLVAHVPQLGNPSKGVTKTLGHNVSGHTGIYFLSNPDQHWKCPASSKFVCPKREVEVVGHVVLSGAAAFSGSLIIFPVGHAAISHFQGATSLLMWISVFVSESGVTVEPLREPVLSPHVLSLQIT